MPTVSNQIGTIHEDLDDSECELSDTIKTKREATITSQKNESPDFPKRASDELIRGTQMQQR